MNDDFLLAIDDGDFIGQIYVHSQNPSGAESVYNALKKHYFCQPKPLPELL